MNGYLTLALEEPRAATAFLPRTTVQIRWCAFPAQQGLTRVIRWRAPAACELGIGKDVERLAARSGKEH